MFIRRGLLELEGMMWDGDCKQAGGTAVRYALRVTGPVRFLFGSVRVRRWLRFLAGGEAKGAEPYNYNYASIVSLSSV